MENKRWLRILIPLVLIVAWLAIAGIGGPTFGKISSVSTNDQAGFLPASADSTKVNEIQASFRESNEIPAIVVAENPDGVQPQDFPVLQSLAVTIGEISGVAPAPEGSDTAVIGPIPSEDGKAVEFIVPLSEGSEGLRTTVEDIRGTVAEGLPTGYTAYTTGPAGLLADLVNAFGGIDGILLFAALGAVFVILLIVYRSLLLPVLVLLTSVFALSAAILGVYWLAYFDVIKISGQTQGILSILVIGAATDYALLLVARFREELFDTKTRWSALWTAVKRSFEPILASAATVILALLCLLFSDLNSNRALGPIAAIGIAFAFLASMTFLPALLATFGRGAFWPFMPKFGGRKTVSDSTPAIAGLEGIRGLWRRVGTLIARRPRVTWIVTALILLACVAGLPTLKANGVPQTEFILGKSEAVDGQAILADHFAAGTGSPAVIIAPEADYQKVMDAAATVDGVSDVTVYTGASAAPVVMSSNPTAGNAPVGGPPSASGAPAGVTPMSMDPKVVDGQVLLNATLDYQADSAEAEAVVKELRTTLAEVNPDVLVGGETAIALDTNTTAQSDIIKIIPIVLAVILIILILLLRSILAPVLLVLSVVLSFGAALGVSALVFNYGFGFPGADATVPLFGFVFLVALGIDYNIFLMTRVREESLRIGTRPGILRGLAVTGGVITSAGVVLAATFAALGVIPILFLVQLAFIVAFGVILDTVIVRSLLVPALAYDIGKKIWWPAKKPVN